MERNQGRTGPLQAEGGRADLERWHRVAAELHACKEAQQRAWGDVDNLELGRYLAGDLSEKEAERLERELDAHPELRTLTDLVREVLDCPDAPPLEQPEPVLLPLKRPARKRPVASFLRRHASVAAAACLVLVLGAAMPRPGYLSAPQPDLFQDGDTFGERGALAPNGRSLLFDRAAPDDKTVARASRPLSSGGAVEVMAERPPALPEPVRHGAWRGLVLRKQGDLPGAAEALFFAVKQSRDRLGEEAPATQWTVRQLADVYQVALNTAPSDQPSVIRLSAAHEGGRSSPKARMKTSAPAPRAEPSGPSAAGREPALALYQQISRQSNQEVRASVVPVLTNALRGAKTTHERLRLLRALGHLGPAAGGAVWALQERLVLSDSAAERREVLQVLGKLGPAARPAVPVLAMLGGVSLTDADAVASSCLNESYQSVKSARLPDDEKKLAARLCQTLRGKDGRIGVDDRAVCFTVAALKQGMTLLRAASKEAGVELLVETGAAGKDVEAFRKRKSLPPRAVHVFLVPHGPVVEVRLGEELLNEGVNPAVLRARLLSCCEQERFDHALEEVRTVVLAAQADRKD